MTGLDIGFLQAEAGASDFLLFFAPRADNTNPQQRHRTSRLWKKHEKKIKEVGTFANTAVFSQ